MLKNHLKIFITKSPLIPRRFLITNLEEMLLAAVKFSNIYLPMKTNNQNANVCCVNEGMCKIHDDTGKGAQISLIINHYKQMLVPLGLNAVLQERHLVQRIPPHT